MENKGGGEFYFNTLPFVTVLLFNISIFRYFSLREFYCCSKLRESLEIDRDFHALSDGILSFLVTYSYRKNKLEKYAKKKKK